VGEESIDQDLLARMALAMQISALGRSARSASGIKLRQPLARARVFAGGQDVDLGTLSDLVIDELNVKLLEPVSGEAELVEYEIGLLPNLLGPKHGRRFPEVRQAVANADAAALARRFQADLSVIVEMGDGGPPVELLPEEVEVRTHGREGYAIASEKGTVVAVDVTLTPELGQEGLARDLVRRIQTMRKEADFQLDDRIVTYLDADEDLLAAVGEWRTYIMTETLSVEIVLGPMPAEIAEKASLQLDGHQISVGVQRA
jgi:isoleucyl-tRNA synthetase